jgi:hydroxymethylbilane synthase
MAQSSPLLRLGTRGSRLALVQAEMVRAALAARGVPCELVPLKTTGDRVQDRPLASLGGKGLFTKELEEALLDGRIDLAVHSMKDVPVALPDGLAIVAVLPREDPRDAFVSGKAASLAALPPGARIGTSSVRRQAQVARARPDLTLVPLRGNVDTRLAKLDAGEIDAALLAYAGLKRLGLESRATMVLAPEDWLPALSQGAIGIETRAESPCVEVIRALNHVPTAAALACERAFQAALDGSCTTSIGGFASVVDNMLRFRGEVLAPDGSGFADTGFEHRLGDAPEEEAASLGRDAGLALKPRVQQWLPG